MKDKILTPYLKFVKLNIWSLRCILAICLATLLGTTGYFFYLNEKTKKSDLTSINSQKATSIKFVTALGRLQPSGEVIALSPPPYQGGAKILELLVKQGDWVEKEQVIAILDNYEQQKAVVERNKTAIEVAKANLAIIKAGAKKGEIDAQKATIGKLKAELKNKQVSQRAIIRRLQAELARGKEEGQATISRLKAELENAGIEFSRRQQLLAEGAISQSEFDQYSSSFKVAQKKVIEAEVNTNKLIEVTQEQLEEERANFSELQATLNQSIQAEEANLAKLLEVRDVDVNKAKAEIAEAEANLKQAKEDLALTTVRSPIEGQVLKIYSYPGEYVNVSQGILELAQTKSMNVVAEVYESDIKKIRLQQTAIITSENASFDGEINGKVNRIGLKIGKKDILTNDPVAATDSRVVEVEIMLSTEDSKKVSFLTNSNVIVKIKI
ncbi:MAG: HlyD family efflux transporter periplasmic adaptor subunit [Microcystis sp.]